jgi:hypothetical protein
MTYLNFRDARIRRDHRGRVTDLGTCAVLASDDGAARRTPSQRYLAAHRRVTVGAMLSG